MAEAQAAGRTSITASLGRTAGQLLLDLWLGALVASAAAAQGVPPLKEDWSQPEQWAWEEIRTGRVADFNAREGRQDRPLDPGTPDDWDDRRRLSPGFLKEILFREPYRGALPVEGVRIVGAWFPELVDLAYGHLDRQLWLENCRFEGAADLAGLRVDGWLSLKGSVFPEQRAARVSVDLTGAQGSRMRNRGLRRMKGSETVHPC